MRFYKPFIVVLTASSASTRVLPDSEGPLGEYGCLDSGDRLDEHPCLNSEGPLDEWGLLQIPKCPEGYETYCCVSVVPYLEECQEGTCFDEQGWTCLAGPGKVESINYCDAEFRDNTAYCKKPGREYFASLIEWNGKRFESVLKPEDHEQFLQAGMEEPSVPLMDSIQWQQASMMARSREELAQMAEYRRRVLGFKTKMD
ncbi:hypothetical protein B0I35DRAFT_161188 [Stachybotrys elegans]|uniref:Uncharacterized protein n=1 Tax=Stachybotrys elegans TaxID=80388 RepID=A0A8K0T0K1_9HYPO|nr:hypothetical protein B0I35DRAFT_161188 [Stachybotrys elegans]